MRESERFPTSESWVSMAGYGQFATEHDYYEDGETALKFEKALRRGSRR